MHPLLEVQFLVRQILGELIVLFSDAPKFNGQLVDFLYFVFVHRHRNGLGRLSNIVHVFLHKLNLLAKFSIFFLKLVQLPLFALETKYLLVLLLNDLIQSLNGLLLVIDFLIHCVFGLHDILFLVSQLYIQQRNLCLKLVDLLFAFLQQLL